jgi:ribonuclease-3
MPASSLKNTASLEKAIGYTFKNKSLAEEAVTHKSFSHESQESNVPFNERLEFLGDAVLGVVISEYLFNNYRDYSEAKLSRIRSYVVQETALAEAAERLNIGANLLLGKGEEMSGGREKPSLLANVFEALLAAIYLDSGMENAREFTLRTLEPKILEYIDKSLVVDFKTKLQEVTQARFGMLPEYKVTTEKGPEHEKVFEVSVLINGERFGTGQGKTKKAASQMAAEESLQKIDQG